MKRGRGGGRTGRGRGGVSACVRRRRRRVHAPKAKAGEMRRSERSPFFMCCSASSMPATQSASISSAERAARLCQLARTQARERTSDRDCNNVPRSSGHFGPRTYLKGIPLPPSSVLFDSTVTPLSSPLRAEKRRAERERSGTSVRQTAVGEL